MAFSDDDDADAFPLSVSNYHFVDRKEEPVSFAILPILWDGVERLDGGCEPVFLYGRADDGLRKVYKQVTAWRFDVCGKNPEISVLSKENAWIKLLKPKKTFEDTIRTILITVQCLCVLRRYPDTPSKSLWDHLDKIFSFYEVRPSQNDLVDHMPLISEAVERDDLLAKSQFLLAFLEEKPIKRRSCHEDVQCTARRSFIVDDLADEDMVNAVEEESDEEDFVCAFCDDGGNLLCCDGRCMRSFHVTEECLSLGLSGEEVDAIEKYFCKNCEYKQHQCYVCGNLGSSDKSSGAEVFQCVNATCGYFYHPKCVSKLLHREDKVVAEELEKKIASGESFSCPVHKCSVCKLGENKKVRELQFAVCRRCPKSYHRKCLPRKITFEGSEDNETTTRAWEGLLPNNRILIYCLNHDIDEDTQTPNRDHIKFPGLEESKIPIQHKNFSPGFTGKGKFPTVHTRKWKTNDFRGIKGRFVSKKENMSDDHFQGNSAAKISKSFERSLSEGKVLGKETEKSLLGSESRKVKVGNVSRKFSNQNAESVRTTKRPDQNKAAKEDSGLGKSGASKPLTKKLDNGMVRLDADSERRLMNLMKNVSSSITLEDVIRKHKVPSTHAYSLKHVVDKTIKMGKLEVSVEAVRAALRKLEEGCSIEDAEAVCEPEVLNHLFRWKNKLRVYLAPFLYGMRYSSFGRHFTKVEKLEEIVDRVHWYIQKGDMIVDFCCGANDFSILMKKKLDETGKQCSYRNFDLIPPKNDFNFEKRDWMTVQTKEFPIGSELIMGLNPPFGVKAALANKFVDKALEFNPKLLILIVPPETQRLDKKKTPYDLVWEDNQFLAGKSFYLPGSVDVNDKQMDQWNIRPPVLYLWSRRDWTDEHKAIAEEHDHLCPREQEESETHNNVSAKTSKMDNNGESQDRRTNLSPEAPQKRQRFTEIPRRGDCETSEEITRSSFDDFLSKSVEIVPYAEVGGIEHQQTGSTANFHAAYHPGRTSSTYDIVGYAAVEGVGHQQSGSAMPGLNANFEAAYDAARTSFGDDITRTYNQEPYAIGTSGWSNNVTPISGIGQMGGHADGFTYQPYTTGLDTYTRDLAIQSYEHPNNITPISDIGQMGGHVDGFTYQPYTTRLDTYTRDVAIQSYEHPNAENLRSNYQAGHDPGYSRIGSLPSPHGHLGMSYESSHWINTSATQRYMLRLDEMNHTRLGGMGAGYQMTNSGPFDPSAHQFGGVPQGFASGPHYPYSNQNSAGWLNE